MEKKDIRKLGETDIKDWLTSIGEKPFRAKQISEWLWEKSLTDFDQMTNLSKPLREKLKEHFTLPHLGVEEQQFSEDGTVKMAFKLHDNAVVEGVLIPTDNRSTACVSIQVGCSLECAFCATGQLKRMRNLMASEVYDQVVAVNRVSLEKFNRPLSNIVFMGMGEPLMNYKGLQEGIEKITSPKGLGMSPRRITVSTAGIARMIKRLADDGVKYNLALSLHAANDVKRSEIMPINDSNSLDALIEALRYFKKNAVGKVTFEYIIFKDFNDSIEDAKELVSFVNKIGGKVNIIEFNPVDHADFERADIEKVDEFAAYLERHDINVNIRRSRGKDIDAACGQLANKNKLSNHSEEGN